MQNWEQRKILPVLQSSVALLADIDRQAEIQSYAEECDIKNIVARAAFDPNFAQALANGAMDGSNADITDYPENVHELKKMAEKAGKTIEEINT